MTFEEFEKADKRVLRARIKACFEDAQEGGRYHNTDRVPERLLEAQFYMQELDRRYDSWIAWRDLVLEVVVIALIGWEIHLAIQQGHDEDVLMGKQNAILTNLESSTQATAAQLKEQLAEQYRVFINPQPNGFSGITLYNNSKSEISLWGLRVGRNPPVKNPRGSSVIAEHTAEPIVFRDYYLRLPTEMLITYDLYLKNAPGEEFIWSGRIDYNGEIGRPPDGALRAEKWSGVITFSPAP